MLLLEESFVETVVVVPVPDPSVTATVTVLPSDSAGGVLGRGPLASDSAVGI